MGNLCRASGKTKEGAPVHSLVKKCVGTRTEDTKVMRPKWSCQCEIHSLVGMKNIKDLHQHVSPCSGSYEGKVPQGNTIQGRVKRGRGEVGCVSEKSSGEVELQAETSSTQRSLVNEGGGRGLKGILPGASAAQKLLEFGEVKEAKASEHLVFRDAQPERLRLGRRIGRDAAGEVGAARGSRALWTKRRAWAFSSEEVALPGAGSPLEGCYCGQVKVA